MYTNRQGGTILYLNLPAEGDHTHAHQELMYTGH